MNLQEILAFTALGFALGYLYRTWFGKKKNNKKCGSEDCSCK